MHRLSGNVLTPLTPETATVTYLEGAGAIEGGSREQAMTIQVNFPEPCMTVRVIRAALE